MPLQPRETVILAEDVDALVEWYRAVLGFTVTRRFTGAYHFCNLENAHGIRLGIAAASQMGVVPIDRGTNTVVLQFQVPDVQALFAHLAAHGVRTLLGPSHDAKDDFWYGAFTDLEGNPLWVVDEHCP